MLSVNLKNFLVFFFNFLFLFYFPSCISKMKNLYKYVLDKYVLNNIFRFSHRIIKLLHSNFKVIFHFYIVGCNSVFIYFIISAIQRVLEMCSLVHTFLSRLLPYRKMAVYNCGTLEGRISVNNSLLHTVDRCSLVIGIRRLCGLPPPAEIKL